MQVFSQPWQRLLLLLLSCNFCGVTLAKRLEVNPQGRYTNLLVAIDPNEPEDWTLVERVKEWVTSFSRQLSTATGPFLKGTNFSLSVGTCHILVPNTWKNGATQVDATATWQSYSVSHVRLDRNLIDPPRRTAINGTCGTEGQYIAFGVQYVRSSQDLLVLGKELLQEFARFRFGVFSEHGNDTNCHFYFAGSRLVPVVCNRQLRGVSLNILTGKPCEYDPDNLHVEPDCRFFIDKEQEVGVSIMTTTDVYDIQYFCTDPYDSDESRRHHEAPHLHQRQCQGRSVAEVMRMHPDFDVRPKMMAAPNVEFKIVQQPKSRKLSIVLDISSSMRGSRMTKMITAVVEFITEMLESGIECSIVTFNTYVQVVRYPAVLNSTEIREIFAESVRRLVASGVTALSDGLMQGMRLLGANPSRPQPDDSGYILLLTDGGENAGTVRIPNATEILSNTSIFVDVVSFGNSADKRMQTLADRTSGIICFDSVNAPNYDLMECMAKMVADRSRAEEKSLVLASGPVPAAFSVPVNVDVSVARDLNFVLNAFIPTDIVTRDIQVVSPNATVYDKNSGADVYSRNNQLGIVTVRVAGRVTPGVWLVSDDTSSASAASATSSSQRRSSSPWSSTNANSLVSITVHSKSAVEDPIELTGTVTGGNLVLNNRTRIVVTGSVQRGTMPVVGGEIHVKVESDRGVHADFELRDDGAEPDVIANDGIHAGLVPLSKVSTVQEYNVRISCQRPVHRVTPVGKFYIAAVDQAGLLAAPPATVRDLRVGASASRRTVFVRFTAVGGRQNEGSASRYEFRTSESVHRLQTAFSECDILTVNAAPLPAGSRQELNVSMEDFPNYNGTFYLALRAVGPTGVFSEVSNIESLQFKEPELIEGIEKITETPITTEDFTTENFTTEDPTTETRTASQPPTTSPDSGSTDYKSLMPGLILLMLVRLLA